MVVDKVKIKVLGVEALRGQLGLLASAMTSFRPALIDISKQIYQEEKKIFSAQGAYGGRGRWASLSEKYQTWKKKKFPGKTILRQRDRLLKQATSNAGVFNLTDTSVEVGVDLPYARVHQLGYKKRNIEPRPYLTITNKQEDKLNNILDKYIYESAKRSGLTVVRISG